MWNGDAYEWTSRKVYRDDLRLAIGNTYEHANSNCHRDGNGDGNRIADMYTGVAN
jgi:hypothetical protein